MSCSKSFASFWFFSLPCPRFSRPLVLFLSSSRIIMGQSPSTPLANCLTQAVGSGNVAFPGPFWEITDVKPYNLDITPSPAAITYPSTNEEVASIITCARSNNAKVQARSGGHSYGNFGLGGGGTTDTVVVDLKNFQQFDVDQESWIATVGAGTLLGDLTDEMQKYGRAMAHGTCPQVGIGGHATIGGLGPMSRMWGAALDHVVEVDVVLANSSIVSASTTNYPDVFWALKGAGASFGVITQFRVITHAIPSQTVQYSYTFSQRPFSGFADRFKLWQNMAADPALDRRLASQVIFSEAGMILEGTFFGSQDEFDALNLTSIFPDASDSSVLVFNDWLGQASHWGEDLALTLGGGIPTAFYSKSLAFTARDTMPDTTIDAWLKYLDDVDKGTLVWFAIFDLQGGATNDVAKDATSYGHRDAIFYLQAYAVNLLRVSDTTRAFVQGMHDVIANSMQGHNLGAYAGFVDPALPNAQLQYWNTNYPRLQQIKAAIDPQDIFHNPQSVQLP
ncbi:uncharacterized protein PV09_07846 [Verruconis gallopava]|uniref:FAD-binding PCMH-type domain-containing protein n=1 Tax=Verruconis gallopava TaxID=253628 RepID=A0A0D2ANF1_9PEZI|nr:uncharacterized protein PV09_07846 [Verruconis gallopava]KIW00659.1 hypothetical protein PV09_07846 [Verruconis gallopava]